MGKKPTSHSSAGPLKLGLPFASNMVVQHGLPLKVFGTGAPGASVSVTFGAASATVLVSPSGSWRATLPPPLPGGPYTLTVASGAQSIVLTNILGGDVWICSGQSNMWWFLNLNPGGPEEAAKANYPNLRFMRIDGTVLSDMPYTPEQKAALADGSFFSPVPWQPCTPESAGAFSAVGFFAARGVQAVHNVPMGMLSNAIPGVPIQAWIPEEALRSHPTLREYPERYDAGLRSPDPPVESVQRTNWEDWVVAYEGAVHRGDPPPPAPNHPYRPGYLYRGAIAPLGPLSIRGVLWYQGESNAQTPQRYPELWKALVASWRAQFERPDLPFYFVQLPGFSDDNWPAFREAQRQAGLASARCGMVTAIDLGEPLDIHPPDKREVGRRASLWIRKNECGETALLASGPTIRSVALAPGLLTLLFDNTGPSLVSKTGANLASFEVRDIAGNWIATPNATIAGTTVRIALPAGVAPRAVRYAWAAVPAASLYNSANLPAPPFVFEIRSAFAPQHS